MVGVGIFKLLNSNQVIQIRFDYTNLSRKPVHPIAKLSRLTLRFEQSDGTLFDFKGVDNQLLLVVKFYQPTAPPPVAPYRSLLNPDYDPDFVRYLAKQNAFAQRLNDPGAYDDDQDQDDDDEDGSGSGSGSGSPPFNDATLRPPRPPPGAMIQEWMQRQVALAERAAGFR